MADKLKELQDKYSKKQTDKPELERPRHAEEYAEKVKRVTEQSRKKHQAAT